MDGVKEMKQGKCILLWKTQKLDNLFSVSMSICTASVSNHHRAWARSYPDQKYFKVLAMRSTERNYCKNLSRAQLFHPYENKTNSHVLQVMPPEKIDSHPLSPWTGERQILTGYFHVCLINANSCIARKKNQLLVKNSINLLHYVTMFFMVMVNTEY